MYILMNAIILFCRVYDCLCARACLTSLLAFSSLDGKLLAFSTAFALSRHIIGHLLHSNDHVLTLCLWPGSGVLQAISKGLGLQPGPGPGSHVKWILYEQFSNAFSISEEEKQVTFPPCRFLIMSMLVVYWGSKKWSCTNTGLRPSYTSWPSTVAIELSMLEPKQNTVSQPHCALQSVASSDMQVGRDWPTSACLDVL